MPSDKETEQREAVSDTTQDKVTWDEILRTQYKHTVPKTDSRRVRRLCVIDNSHRDKITYSDGTTENITEQAACVEVMTKEMSDLVYKLNQQQGSQIASPWLQYFMKRWQLTYIRGSANIRQYTSSQYAAQYTFARIRPFLNSGDREKLMMIHSGGDTAAYFGGRTWNYMRQVVRPVGAGLDRYIDSWKSGAQQRLFHIWWSGIEQHGVLTLASRIANAVAQAWNRLDGDK
ncbi:hypothetical protein EV183_005049 [Coemansia sp. RSA 2336]|nr:hypothetical protein EV183_005049 [Coemansia sp. RSA 2336]